MRTRYSETEFYRTIGDFLRSARISQQISTEGLAARTGIAPMQISAYEHGDAQISVIHMVNIADALNVSVASLFENGGERVSVSALDIGYLNQTLTTIAMQIAEIKENASL